MNIRRVVSLLAAIVCLSLASLASAADQVRADVAALRTAWEREGVVS